MLGTGFLLCIVLLCFVDPVCQCNHLVVECRVIGLEFVIVYTNLHNLFTLPLGVIFVLLCALYFKRLFHVIETL